MSRISQGEVTLLRQEHELMKRVALHRHASLIACEEVSGDYLKNSKHLHYCFDVSYGEDCAHTFAGFKVKDLMDVCHATEGELAYEGMSVGYASHRILFTNGAWSCSNLLYCDNAQSSQNLFGCIGMKHANYCILNKQYTEEEYERLVPQIIERMRQDGVWGEFFPSGISPFAYNETTAQTYFKTTADEAIRYGFRWRQASDTPLSGERTVAAHLLPASIEGTPDEVLKWAILCEATGRPFRIVKQELLFYREHHLPLPHLHPDERHRRRMALRNPRKLWNRNCADCHKPIATSYAPERPETVYCEPCYLKEVY
jgi:hypothetical protein